VGAPPLNPINSAHARALAKRAAINRAHGSLLEVIKGIQIDSRSLLKDLMNQNHDLTVQLQTLLKKSQVVDISYLREASVEATVAIKLTGSLTDLLLPKNIRKINLVQQPHAPNQGHEKAYTGLLVDCRGFLVKPVMAPLILDENGKEVYGSASGSREYAVNPGMARYTRDMTGAKTNPRVAKRPLIVKGIRTAKKGPFDIIISNADAAKIRGTASNLSFLQKCRVIIVMD